MEGQVIIAGDFNQVMDGVIDRSRLTGKSSPKDRAAIKMLRFSRYMEISEPT